MISPRNSDDNVPKNVMMLVTREGMKRATVWEFSNDGILGLSSLKTISLSFLTFIKCGFEESG
jgi:hypothetical protein